MLLIVFVTTINYKSGLTIIKVTQLNYDQLLTITKLFFRMWVLRGGAA